jgi:hypothetical protein
MIQNRSQQDATAEDGLTIDRGASQAVKEKKGWPCVAGRSRQAPERAGARRGGLISRAKPDKPRMLRGRYLPSGTARFMKAAGREHTLEGLLDRLSTA